MQQLLEVPHGERPNALAPAPGPSRTAIVAEDDGEMRAVLVEWLESIGYAAIECESSLGLIDRLIFMPTPDLDSLDLIVADHRMPELTGLDALETVGALPLPPVLFITAYCDQDLVDRTRALGAVQVLPKPFDRHAFLRAVLTVVN